MLAAQPTAIPLGGKPRLLLVITPSCILTLSAWENDVVACSGTL